MSQEERRGKSEAYPDQVSQTCAPLLSRKKEAWGKYSAPFFLFSVTMFSIFAAEVVVMFILSFAPVLSTVQEAFIDGFLLSVLVTPSIYFFVYKPILLHVSERRKIEQLKDHVIDVVAHELKNPLWVIQESLGLVLGEQFGDLNQAQRKILASCKKSADNLIKITRDLLDISRLEAGKVKLDLLEADMAGIAREVVAFFEQKARAKGLQLKHQIPANPVMVCIDAGKIHQVISNLVNNAIRFTECGFIEVLVVEKESCVECSILDTGCGIEQKDLARLFHKFEQVGAVVGAEEKGFGLGLVIAKEIVELHGGRITVESFVNSGTKFTFILPKDQNLTAVLPEYQI